MQGKRTRRREASNRLLKVLAAAQSARELEDRILTDRDGELLPDPAEEPAEENAFAPGATSRRST